MKEKLFWLSICAIFISGIANYLFYKSNQLEEPIFLDHLIAQDIYHENDMVTLTFYYLTNKDNPMQVNYIEIGDVFGYTMDQYYVDFWHESQPAINFHQEFTYYYLVPINIELYIDEIPFKGEESWKFNTIDVYYVNGEHQTVDIGEVIISKENESKITGLDFSMTSGGTDGFGETLFSSQMAHEITSVQYPFAGKVEDQVAIKMETSEESSSDDESSNPDWLKNGDYEKWNSKNGSLITDLFEPIQIGQHGWVRIYTQVKSNHSRIIEFPIDIRGMTDSGHEFHTSAYVDHVSYLEEKQVKEIISSKRAGGE